MNTYKIILIICLFGLLGCKAKSFDTKLIVGTWFNDDIKLVLKSDLTCIFDIKECTYTINEKEIVIDDIKYEYIVASNELILTNNNNVDTYVKFKEEIIYYDESLIGRWKSLDSEDYYLFIDNDSIYFEINNEISLSLYVVESDRIILETNDIEIEYEYSIIDDKLVMKHGDDLYTYIRIDEEILSDEGS